MLRKSLILLQFPVLFSGCLSLVNDMTYGPGGWSWEARDDQAVAFRILLLPYFLDDPKLRADLLQPLSQSDVANGLRVECGKEEIKIPVSENLAESFNENVGGLALFQKDLITILSEYSENNGIGKKGREIIEKFGLNGDELIRIVTTQKQLTVTQLEKLASKYDVKAESLGLYLHRICINSAYNSKTEGAKSGLSSPPKNRSGH